MPARGTGAIFPPFWNGGRLKAKVMEHISEILKKQTRINSSKANMATLSNAEDVASEKICPVCKGARFVHPLLSPGKPDYSRIVPCRCVEKESDSKRQSRLQNYSNLGTLTRLTFANLIPEGRVKESASQEQFRRVYEAGRGIRIETGRLAGDSRAIRLRGKRIWRRPSLMNVLITRNQLFMLPRPTC